MVGVVATTHVVARHLVPAVKDAGATTVQVIWSISSALVAHTVAATLVLAPTLFLVVPARLFASVVMLALVLLVPLKT